MDRPLSPGTVERILAEDPLAMEQVPAADQPSTSTMFNIPGVSVGPSTEREEEWMDFEPGAFQTDDFVAAWEEASGQGLVEYSAWLRQKANLSGCEDAFNGTFPGIYTYGANVNNLAAIRSLVQGIPYGPSAANITLDWWDAYYGKPTRPDSMARFNKPKGAKTSASNDQWNALPDPAMATDFGDPRWAKLFGKCEEKVYARIWMGIVHTAQFCYRTYDRLIFQNNPELFAANPQAAELRKLEICHAELFRLLVNRMSSVLQQVPLFSQKYTFKLRQTQRQNMQMTFEREDMRSLMHRVLDAQFLSVYYDAQRWIELASSYSLDPNDPTTLWLKESRDLLPKVRLNQRTGEVDLFVIKRASTKGIGPSGSKVAATRNVVHHQKTVMSSLTLPPDNLFDRLGKLQITRQSPPTMKQTATRLAFLQPSFRITTTKQAEIYGLDFDGNKLVPKAYKPPPTFRTDAPPREVLALKASELIQKDILQNIGAKGGLNNVQWRSVQSQVPPGAELLDGIDTTAACREVVSYFFIFHLLQYDPQHGPPPSRLRATLAWWFNVGVNRVCPPPGRPPARTAPPIPDPKRQRIGSHWSVVEDREDVFPCEVGALCAFEWSEACVVDRCLLPLVDLVEEASYEEILLSHLKCMHFRPLLLHHPSGRGYEVDVYLVHPGENPIEIGSFSVPEGARRDVPLHFSPTWRKRHPHLGGKGAPMRIHRLGKMRSLATGELDVDEDGYREKEREFRGRWAREKIASMESSYIGVRLREPMYMGALQGEILFGLE